MSADEGWDESPPRKWIDYIPVALLVLAVTGLVAWGLLSSRRPDALPSLAGCYVGSGPLVGERVLLDPAGILVAGDTRTAFGVTEDKEGLSIVLKKPIFDPSAFKGELVSDHLKLRIADDRRSFRIYRDGPDAVFSRTPCP